MNTTTENTALAAAPQPAELTRLDAASMILGPAWDRIQSFGKMMSRGGITVPKHFHGNEADCAAVTMQALTWGMNPFAVAQKTHITPGGTLGYEAQLVNAVIQNSGALGGDPEYEFLGDWSKVLGKVEEKRSEKGGKYYVATYTRADEEGLGVTVRATLQGEQKPRELTIMMSQAYPRFSTQWATDPKQQICYLALRKFVRLYKPGVILGVYTEDEMPAPTERDITAEVERETPPRKVWDDAAWESAIEKLATRIRSQRATIQEALDWARARADLTDAQVQKLHQKVREQTKPAQEETTKDTPAFTYAQVAEKIHGAKTADELDEAASLISAVEDAAQREELTAIYQQKGKENAPL